jgi:hypothetical protein
MPELKPLSVSAVPRALEKAERYRLLNEPTEAESICLDILGVDAGNQRALVVMLLALTDQFDEHGAEAGKARALLPRLQGEYERAYYAGIICERWAKARLKRGGPGSGFMAYEDLLEAMAWYEAAEGLRPADNDDALLRWNACSRFLAANPTVQRGPQETVEAPLE